MESIAELKVKVRKSFTPDQYRGRPWFTEKITRRISIYVTWFFLRMGLSANIVSLLVVIVGFLSGAAFIRGNFLFGVLILQCWYVIDAVDGEVARYHRMNDLTGDYCDKLMHYVVESWVFYSLGIGLSRTGDTFWIHYIGLWVAFFFTLLKLIYDLKYKCYIEQSFTSQKGLFFHVKIKGKQDLPTHYLREKIVKTYSLYPNVMNIITITVVLDSLLRGVQWIGGQWSLLLVLLLSYALFYPLACLKELYFVVRDRKIDREYSEVFISQG